MTPEEIITKAEAFGGWYHSIELVPGYRTRSYMGIADQWDMVRRVREKLDYTNKIVLDIGTMDGMWAFEAERLGAYAVTAIDVWQGGYIKAMERFTLAKTALESKVTLIEDSVEELVAATDNFVTRFDIIQCPGVLYHLENPIRALRNMRKAVKPNGRLLLETAIWSADGKPFARFNCDRGVYNDPTTFWAPNMACLLGMLHLSMWQPITKPQFVDQGKTKRVCLLCAPVE